jgi:hypothetical protein
MNNEPDLFQFLDLFIVEFVAAVDPEMKFELNYFNICFSSFKEYGVDLLGEF